MWCSRRDDDSGTGLNSRITHTASFTGTHFLQAREFLNNASGTYQVAVSEGVADNLSNNIVGTAVDDAINGVGGNDTINGGGGNDRLRGGTGRDILTGSTGDDRFIYHLTSESVGATRDLITAFEFGSAANPNDKIDVFVIDANTGLAGNQAFSTIEGVGIGQLSFSDLANGSTLIRGNTSALAGFELEIEVADGGTTAASWNPTLDFIL